MKKIAFQEKHSLYAGLDYFINESNSEKYYFNLEGFSSENMTSIGNARQYAENGIPSESSAKKRMFGLTANVNYTYDSRGNIETIGWGIVISPNPFWHWRYYYDENT